VNPGPLLLAARRVTSRSRTQLCPRARATIRGASDTAAPRGSCAGTGR
jgi:hypothetical protein